MDRREAGPGTSGADPWRGAGTETAPSATPAQRGWSENNVAETLQPLADGSASHGAEGHSHPRVASSPAVPPRTLPQLPAARQIDLGPQQYATASSPPLHRPGIDRRASKLWVLEIDARGMPPGQTSWAELASETTGRVTVRFIATRASPLIRSWAHCCVIHRREDFWRKPPPPPMDQPPRQVNAAA